MSQTLDRKSFLGTLGAAGLGLGLALGIGAPAAMAQEAATPAAGTTTAEVGPWEKRAELYAAFTAALADELGAGSADEVDAAIRQAMMTVIDAQVADGLLTAGQAEALKTLVATAEVPFGPGMFGRGPGGFMHGEEGFGPGRGGRGWDDDDRKGPRDGRMLPGMDDDRQDDNQDNGQDDSGS